MVSDDAHNRNPDDSADKQPDDEPLLRDLQRDDDEDLPAHLRARLDALAQTHSRPASRWGRILMFIGASFSILWAGMLAIMFGIVAMRRGDAEFSLVTAVPILFGLAIIFGGWLLHRWEQE
jgi:hypothetical protein